MQPQKIHYFFAENWPLKIWISLITLFTAVAAVAACDAHFSILRDWRIILWLTAVFILALPVGYFTAILLAWFVLGPIYYGRALKNGAPFHPNDKVLILVGPYRGYISRVYKSWQGDSVRVELGQKAKDDFKDIFGPTQILKQ